MVLLDGRSRSVCIPLNPVRLAARLAVPDQPRGAVIFVNGGASDRLDRSIARELWCAQFATLTFDLSSAAERSVRGHQNALYFELEAMGLRVAGAVDWVRHQPELNRLPVMLFGTGTGTAVALAASVYRPNVIAVVSRNGRPDLAGDLLARVGAPTLLIVDGHDPLAAQLNREALLRMRCERQLMVVPDPDAPASTPQRNERVAELARRWFEGHLPATDGGGPGARTLRP